MGIRTVMITGDNPMTAAAIAAEAGVDDFLAQATPEDKLKLIRDEQAKGKLVAMCGDGTNDAPALAQADVGVAMNTGTQAAREAGNMVDLDSNPTKLIEVVEIGKQLLMTRGALTTFSIANDVAKYFAIIPAMFLAFYPQLEVLNVMHLASPQSAILSAIIFNALIIIALIPLALKGVRLSRRRRRRAAAPQPADLRSRRHHHSLYRHQGHRPRRRGLAPGLTNRHCERSEAIHSSAKKNGLLRRFAPRNDGELRRHTMLREIRPAILILLLLTAITGLAYPLAMTAIAGVIFPKQAQGSLIEKDGKVIGSALIGQEFKDDKYFHGRPSATLAPDPADSTKTVSAPYNAANSGGSNLGPTSKALNDRVKEDVEKLKAENPSAAVPVDLVTTSASGLDPDISPEGALFQVPRVAKARNMPEDRVRQLVTENTKGRFAGIARRAPRQRPGAQSGAGRGLQITVARLSRKRRL